MKGNWHFIPSFVVQVEVTSFGLTEMEAGARTEDPPLFTINGKGHFLPSFSLQVMRAARSAGVVRENAGAGSGAGSGARTGVGAAEGALEPPLNPSHLSLQSTQGSGVSEQTPFSKHRPL